ncbi:MAG TPA: RNA polymerase sigma factor [Myxococcota bacterium]
MAQAAPKGLTFNDVVAKDPLRALFDRARAGDSQALEQLCVQMRPRLYRASYSILHDADEADDIAQEALIRAVARRFLFLGRGSVGGWMTRIATNLAKNRIRDGRRRKEILETAGPEEKSVRGAQPSAPQAPDLVASEKETRGRLVAAVAALPERQRDVVRLHVIGQMDFAEVAEALGMTEANARVTFSHAKKKLVAALGGDDEPVAASSGGRHD